MKTDEHNTPARRIARASGLPAALGAAFALPLALAAPAQAQDGRWYSDRAGQSANYEATPGYQSELDHDAYYDGYFDGYYDAAFGMDTWDADSDARYGASYTSGYHDGYYDAQEEFEFEPAYYILDHDDDDLNAGTADQRSKDKVRKRGDRSGRDGARAAASMTDLERKRGTIDRIADLDTDARPDHHTVLRLTMDDGKTVLADFGPAISRDEVPFSEGDRITLAGDTVTDDGKTYLIVERITIGQKKIALRGQRGGAMAGQNWDGRAYDGRRQQWPAGRTDDRSWDQGRRGWTADRSDASFDRSSRVSLTGRLRDVERARTVRGQSVFLIELSDGRTRMVAMDAGQAERLRMREGDRVEITGDWASLAGRDVIRVVRLRQVDSED